MIIGNGVDRMDGVDPQMNLVMEADIREEVCTIVTAIVANMELTTNYYGAIWRQKLMKYYPTFTMDNLQTDIANLDSLMIDNNTVNYLNFEFVDNPMWTLSDVNGTLDPVVENDLSMTRFNITLVKKFLY